MQWRKLLQGAMTCGWLSMACSIGLAQEAQDRLNALGFRQAYKAGPEISSAVGSQHALVASHPKVQSALAHIRNDENHTLSEQKALVAIESPPFKEQARARDFLSRLQTAGLKSAYIDKEGNVIAPRPGTGRGPKLVFSAHLDTVFPAGTDLTIKEKDGKLYAPGIGDDTRGLAEILSMVRALNAGDIQTVGDIWFVGTVGEEGLGDLRGVKALFRDHQDIDGFVSVDGLRPERITYIAVGSHRYRVTFKGPGGHSFSAFGLPSAIHALGRAVAKISELKAPVEPKTTFTVGTVTGGTSVNAIAEQASFEIDMRSVGMVPLLALEASVMQAIHNAVVEENARWNSQSITVDVRLVGQRPAGMQPLNAPIVQAAALAVRSIGLEPILEQPGSTDSNAPISLGIPAVTVGRGGLNGKMHSLDEWFDPKDAFFGPQKHLLLALTLVGLKDVSAPVLTKAAAK